MPWRPITEDCSGCLTPAYPAGQIAAADASSRLALDPQRRRAGSSRGDGPMTPQAGHDVR
jgi:hypothetical protein